MLTRTPTGDESARLSVNELDEDGRMARSVLFDDDDLVAAIAELDRAYFVGEGAPFQRVLRAVGRYSAAYEERDDKDRLAPDFVLVDHQPLGFGVGDRDYFLEMERVDQTEGRGVNRVLYVNEHALLAVNAQTPISQHGSRYERSGCVVMGVDASDRINRIEMFADDDFAAALARFDELGVASPADPRTAEAENATTKLIARTLDLMNRGEWEALTRHECGGRRCRALRPAPDGLGADAERQRELRCERRGHLRGVRCGPPRAGGREGRAARADPVALR